MRFLRRVVKAVWKYTLLENGYAALGLGVHPGDQEISVAMPKGAAAFKLAPQGADLCIWALVDPDETFLSTATYRVVATGKRLPDDWLVDWMYVDAVFAPEGEFVWHVFEKVSP